jgi:hypothetical protein
MPEPDIHIFLGQNGKIQRNEPILIFPMTGANVQTAPRSVDIFASNTGGTATGPFRLSLYLPLGVSLVPNEAMRVGLQSIQMGSEEYVEALLESEDGVERNDVAQRIARFAVAGLTPMAKLRWKFNSGDYSTSGSIKIALN